MVPKASTICKHVVLILTLLFVLSQTSTVYATVYYVSVATGDDDNPGTEMEPWYTIKKATTILIAGDTVLVKGGTYELEGTNTRYIPALNPVNSGTIGNPIVFKTYCNDTVNLVQHDFGGPLIGSLGRSFIVWDGFTVHECTTYEGFTETEHNIVVLWNSFNCVIKNCEVIGVYNTLTSDNHIGIRIENSVDPKIQNCKIHDVQNEVAHEHAGGIDNWRPGTLWVENLIVENCEIYNCGTGISNHEGGTNNIYRNNYIHDCTARGFGFSTQGGTFTTNGKVYQNLLVDVGLEPIYFNPAGELTDFEVFNNTIVTYNASAVGEISFAGCPNIKLWNNIIVQAGSHENILSERHGSTSNISYLDYNSYDIDGVFVLHLYATTQIIYSNFFEWTSLTGHDVNSIIGNPLFVNADEKDFRLQSDSPCLLAGIDLQDYNNNGDSNESINMGAFINDTDIIGTYPYPLGPECPVIVGTKKDIKNDDEIVIFPNPTTGLITLTNVGDALVYISDVSGKLILKEMIKEKGILDIEGLSNGIYFITIQSNSTVATKKIIKR